MWQILFAHPAAAMQPAPMKATTKRGGGGAGAGEERRKGVPWTEEEHRLFVAGLQEFGKGDWRSISRNYVLTRTPTQASRLLERMLIGKQNVRASMKLAGAPHGRKYRLAGACCRAVAFEGVVGHRRSAGSAWETPDSHTPGACGRWRATRKSTSSA